MIRVKVIAKSNTADFETALETFLRKGWSIAYFNAAGDTGNKLTALLLMDDTDAPATES